MKPIIQTTCKEYRKIGDKEMCGQLYEAVEKLHATVKEISVFNLPVVTKVTVDGTVRITKIFGIPIWSSRRELWDYRP